MPPKQERDAEEDDATWRYRNLERKLVLKETIYGPSHIAIVPTLFELACASMKKCIYGLTHIAVVPTLYELALANFRKLENIDESVTLLERALSIKDAHPSDASFPGTMWILLYLCTGLFAPCFPDITKITYVVERSLSLQEEQGLNLFLNATIMEYLCLKSNEQRRVEF